MRAVVQDPAETVEIAVRRGVSDLRVGERVLGRYVIEARLGQGGQASVFRALDTQTGTAVALKLLSLGGPADARALREIHALRLLDRPGVVRLLDEGRTGDHAVLVLNLVEGQPFPGHRGPLPWSRIASQCFELLDALASIHAVEQMEAGF